MFKSLGKQGRTDESRIQGSNKFTPQGVFHSGCGEVEWLRGKYPSGNLKKMRIFYEEWQCLSIGSPLANQLQQLENKIEEGVEIGEKTLLCINRPIESADLRIKTKQDMPEELQKALPDQDKMKDLYCKSL